MVTEKRRMAAKKRTDETTKLEHEACGWVLYQLYKTTQSSKDGEFSLFFDIETGEIHMQSYVDSDRITEIHGWHWINAHNFFFDVAGCQWESFFNAVRLLYMEDTMSLINPVLSELGKMKTIEEIKLYIDMNG